MNVQDIAITSLEAITNFDLVTGEWLFTLDELQSASIAQAEERQDITGKQGRKISSLKKNKAVTVSGSNGFVSGGLMEHQVGGKFVRDVTNVMWMDYLKVTGNSATTTYKAVGTTGKEIIAVYLKNGDAATDTNMVQDAQAGAGKFAYDPASKKLTFTGLADGTDIVVCYQRKIQASTLKNMSDSYSGKVAMYVDAMGEDSCGNIYRVQIYIPKADFHGEFSIDLGGDQMVHSFTAEALAGACGAGGMLWSYTIFGANTEDAA